jgi:predicted ATPase
VHSLSSSPTDYRLIKHGRGNMQVYSQPISKESARVFNSQFYAISQGKEPHKTELSVDGRRLLVPIALYYSDIDTMVIHLFNLIKYFNIYNNYIIKGDSCSFL